MDILIQKSSKFGRQKSTSSAVTERGTEQRILISEPFVQCRARAIGLYGLVQVIARVKASPLLKLLKILPGRQWHRPKAARSQ